MSEGFKLANSLTRLLKLLFGGKTEMSAPEMLVKIQSNFIKKSVHVN